MKKSFTLLSVFLLSLIAFQLDAQVSITQDNFPRQASFTDSAMIALSGFDLPSEGDNQLWDYSTLLPDFPVATDSYFDATNDPDFPDALNYVNRELNLFIGGLTLAVPYKSYQAIDENGWYRTGAAFEEVTAPLTSITGGPDDKLFYPASKADYVGRVNFLEFPVNYQNQTTGTRYFDLNYEVTAGVFGLNQTPAFTRYYRSEDRNIIGQGQLILPKSDGTPSPPMDVLLAEVFVSRVDSFFLGGAPTPLALLAGFGLEQGKSSEFTFYAFYKEDFGAPVMLFDSIFTTGDFRVVYRPQAGDFSSSLNNLDLVKMKSFPNPVSAGAVVNIAAENINLTSGKINFYDLQGRLIFDSVLERSSDEPFQIKIPTTIGNGMLMYQILDKNNTPVGQGRLEVF